jgi:hypothetical protein
MTWLLNWGSGSQILPPLIANSELEGVAETSMLSDDGDGLFVVLDVLRSRESFVLPQLAKARLAIKVIRKDWFRAKYLILIRLFLRSCDLLDRATIGSLLVAIEFGCNASHLRQQCVIGK